MMAVYFQRTNQKLDRLFAVILAIIAFALISDGFVLGGLTLGIAAPLLWTGTQEGGPLRAFVVRILSILIIFVAAGTVLT